MSFAADTANTIVKIVNGTEETSLLVGTTTSTAIKYNTKSDSLIIFGSITQFNCYDNGINGILKVDFSQNTSLIRVNLRNNYYLDTVDVSKLTNLTSLSVFNTAITSLDVSHNPLLTSLNCAACRNFSTLDVSNNPQLEYLDCYKSNLSSLNVSKNTKLYSLYCDDNNLSSLDISKNTDLKTLSCYGNNFSTQAYDEIMCALPQCNNVRGTFYPLKDSADANSDIFMKTNSQNVIDKKWYVFFSSGSKTIPATNGTYKCLDMNQYIILQVKQGEQIGFNCAATENNTPIKIVSGDWDTILNVGTSPFARKYFQAKTDTIIIYGNVKSLDCRENGKNITAIDISKSEHIITLYCLDNNITSLKMDANKNTELRYFSCHGNPLTTQAFDEIMCALPQLSDGTANQFAPLRTEADTNYNAFMASNSNNAKTKNWNVRYWTGSTDIAATSGTFNCSSVDIAENNVNMFSLYPNPANTTLNISGLSSENIFIYDITGRLVIRKENIGENTLQLDISDLAKGMYFVRIGKSTTKFVKE